MDMFALLPKTGVGALLDILLLVGSVAIGRVMRSRQEALALAYGAGVLTHLVAQASTGPIMFAAYHVVPRLLLAIAGVCFGRLLAVTGDERLRFWVQRRVKP